MTTMDVAIDNIFATGSVPMSTKEFRSGLVDLALEDIDGISNGIQNALNNHRDEWKNILKKNEAKASNTLEEFEKRVELKLKSIGVAVERDNEVGSKLQQNVE
uniref:Uncharacterized protein n=1 Tax=Glossina pallidipes TaxID=7398 RepID=A0A1B0AK54_GLOPL